MSSILGDPSEAEYVTCLPTPYRFTSRLAELENLRGSVSSYLSNVDFATPIPASRPAPRSILEDSDLCPTPPRAPPSDIEAEIDLSPSPVSDPGVEPSHATEQPSEIPQQRGVRKKRVTKLAQRKPVLPRRNFIKENILNLKTIRKSPAPLGPEGENWVNRLLRPASKPRDPVVIRGILKPDEERHSAESPEELRRRIETAKIVRNEGLLGALFEKVADSLALHWEEAVDLIIGEMLEEEALRLCAMEESPPEPLPTEINVNSLLSLVQSYSDSAESLRQKYCL